jgi:chitinase
MNERMIERMIVLGYVTAWSEVMPDPALVTHINYAFGKVNSTFNGIEVSNPPRLKAITALKAQKPELKVMLSVGGWTAGGFSEMAATSAGRRGFAESALAACQEFNLDGIDMDWEYPSTSMAGISSSPDDVKNFTTLIEELRKTLGSKLLLTAATAAKGEYYDFRALDPLMDFINVMVYDSGRPPVHHSAVYPSEISGRWSCQTAIEAHVAQGMSQEKLVLGIPFYGHGDGNVLSDFIDYKDIVNLKDFDYRWDDTAKAAWLADKAGRMVCAFDDTHSIEEKCRFIREKGLLGGMYWEYSTDNGTLREALAKNLLG